MSPTAEPTKAINIFFSYAHQDEKLRNELEKHLSVLKRQGQITSWHDREITPGTEWANEINTYLNTANIILLLVSPNFIASDYCFSREMKRAMERHERGEALVIPIILRPTNWKRTLFGKLQALPRNSRPVTLWKSRDTAFFEITEDIRKVINELATKSSVNISISKQSEGIIEKPTFSYDVGLAQLHERLRDNSYYDDVMVLEVRLKENMHRTDLFGETELSRSERAYIVSELNRLTLKVLGVSFNDLCYVKGSDKSKHLADLEDYIRESYLFIRGHEDVIRISDDPKEKAQAQRSIDTQWDLIRGYLTEYMNLAKELDVNVPTGINQIAAHFGDEDITDKNLTIRNALIKTFSISELRLFCLDLGVDLDILPGENVEAKVFALIDYMKRRSRMGELVEYLQRKRPSLSL